jgi:hypothetical protein
MPGFISVLNAGSRFSSSKRSEILAQVKVKATVNQKKSHTKVSQKRNYAMKSIRKARFVINLAYAS